MSASTPAARSAVYAVITGGGTGGHVYPALALADELVERGHPATTLVFVGSERGLEATAVPAAGYSIHLLPGRGLQRGFRLANLRVVRDSSVAFVRASALLRRIRPRVVVGVGGYASLPCVVAARLLRVPTVIHEQNAAPGLANRVAVRLRARAAISLPGTPLRDAVLTGNPIRASIAAVRREPDPRRPLVGIFGGSLGAGRLNDAALELFERWRDRDDVVVRHISGARNFDDVADRLRRLRRDDDKLRYELIGYEEHMDALYARTTVAVCRAGAITVAELAAAGVPAVLVPLAGAPGDHQTRNAEALVSEGAAELLPDEQCTGARLDSVLRRLLNDQSGLDRMAAAAKRAGRPDAVVELADLVEAVASGG